MINKDRVVSVTSIDLLSLFGVILKAAGVTLDVLETNTVDGDFVIEQNPANAVLASEPVRSLDFAGTTDAAVVYFVPTYDYKGFKIAGSDVATTGDEVVADHANLYKATLATGAVTIEKAGV